jgi:serine/threonine protein kinase
MEFRGTSQPPATEPRCADTWIDVRRLPFVLDAPAPRFSRIESFGRFVTRAWEAEGAATLVASAPGNGEGSTVGELGRGLAWEHDRELEPGERVGPYRIEARIGRGAFGTVYRASQARRGAKLAIKVLSGFCSEDPQMRSRFRAEARTARRVRHPNVVELYGTGVLEDGRPYHVMELLSGTSLDKHLAQQGRLGLQEALPILRGLASAVDAAHRAGVAHRDLKPANVFLAEQDGRIVPKLIDFGISKLAGHATEGHQTEVGTLIGTPEYMAPEQCAAEDVDFRADVYAFGVITYELLVGDVPFRGRHPVEILRRHVTELAPAPSRRVPGLPAAVDEVVAWLLDKHPERRPERLSPVVDALESVPEDRAA